MEKHLDDSFKVRVCLLLEWNFAWICNFALRSDPRWRPCWCEMLSCLIEANTTWRSQVCCGQTSRQILDQRRNERTRERAERMEDMKKRTCDVQHAEAAMEEVRGGLPEDQRGVKLPPSLLLHCLPPSLCRHKDGVMKLPVVLADLCCSEETMSRLLQRR